MERILTRILSGEPVRLFTDEYRGFIWVNDLAKAIDGLIQKKAAGLFHVSGPEKLSRFDLGSLVLRACGRDKKLIIPASLANWSGRPPRAPDVSLDTGKLLSTIDISFHRAEEVLRIIYGRGKCH